MENEIVKLTEKAIQHISSIVEMENKGPGFGVRLGVVGGGCSGLSYKVELSQKNEKDNVQEYGQIQVFIDPKSSIYLKDVVLDFKDGLNGKGLVFENPQAKNTCGCGESFSV
jgi:iron-sulfur cluster assembly protein